MQERRKMTLQDWLNAAANVVIGLLLGFVLNGLLQLVVDGAWAVAAIIAVLSVGFALFLISFDGLIGRMLERIFPSGLKPARSPVAERAKPVARLLSLPLGVLLGMILAQLGLTNAILGLF